MAKPAGGKRSYDWPMRLHVFLARSGIASRRKSEALIAQGRVRVNDTVITEQGTQVGPEDRVYFDGREVHITRQKYYLALNKPAKVLCSNHDPEGRPLAVDLVKSDVPVRLFTVGRLDFMSTGLVFLTNDGEFADAVMHPSSGVEKEYIVETKDPVPREMLEEYRNGIRVEGTVYTLKSFDFKNGRKVHLTLEEGKNREIREVFMARKLKIKRLHRIRIGPVRLSGTRSGGYRELSEQEVAWFFSQAEGRGRGARGRRQSGRSD